MKRPMTSQSDDDLKTFQQNVAALEERARNRMATNQEGGGRLIQLPSGQGWAIFALAVIGAAVSVVVLSAFFYPIALTSYKFWVG